MATATKKVRAAAPPDRTRPAVPEAASLEFRIYLDNGGRYSWVLCHTKTSRRPPAEKFPAAGTIADAGSAGRPIHPPSATNEERARFRRKFEPEEIYVSGETKDRGKHDLDLEEKSVASKDS